MGMLPNDMSLTEFKNQMKRKEYPDELTEVEFKNMSDNRLYLQSMGLRDELGIDDELWESSGIRLHLGTIIAEMSAIAERLSIIDEKATFTRKKEFLDSDKMLQDLFVWDIARLHYDNKKSVERIKELKKMTFELKHEYNKQK
ncbi:hypothetical protein P8832_23090 [Bacillus subtilis]|uniref:hypothetical protein n=1 Tax=Bacillus subtilis TaxID=1423 RepID=UPI001F5665B4|nr:hypothetical protein [Bacillus subtilis]MEC0394646.1 hypothetical protein [Bacillus subtilis]MEC0436909.1 hypothetical protein [Bacillus subtilis]UNL92006.1 hypothetical protein IE382_23015 [Bacillus subtilis]UWJ03680.1 hypothetical protein N0B18_22385 [Bacillus subtilis]WRU08009.1 hypothetical protein VDS58_23070 [Bacillus subtilis]